MEQDKLIIGKISGVHGVRGEIKVFPMTDEPERYRDLNTIEIKNKIYHIETVRLHKGSVLLTLDEIPDRNAAERLKGNFIQIPREAGIPLAENEYYIEDLKGLDAYDFAGGHFGILKEIIQTGAVDVLVFKCPNQKELLIPFTNENISDINLKNRSITVDTNKGVLS